MADIRVLASLASHPVPRAISDPVPDKLPPLFRVQSIERLPGARGDILNRARLFHERASLSVEWLTRHADIRLVRGSLASIRWLGRPASCDGHVRISRLVLLERPEAETNLFVLTSTQN